jgi:hypothetical protein
MGSGYENDVGLYKLEPRARQYTPEAWFTLSKFLWSQEDFAKVNSKFWRICKKYFRKQTNARILKAHSLSLSGSSMIRLSFSRVSMLFLNSWRVSAVPYYVTTHPPAIQKQHWHSRETQIEPPLIECKWAFRIQALRPYSKSSLTLALNEWRFNLSFSWVLMLFLNSWRVSVVPYYVATHHPAIQKQHRHSRKAQIEPPLIECEWAFRIRALVINSEPVLSNISYKSFKTCNLPMQNSHCDHRNLTM